MTERVKEDSNEATVIIVNTCGFIDAAKEESVNTILEMADLKETSLRTSLIVGFPGETEEDVDRLTDYVNEKKFDCLGIFAYSNEEPMYDAPEIDGEVFISNCRAAIGSIQKVRVTHAFEFDLSGEGIA